VAETVLFGAGLQDPVKPCKEVLGKVRVAPLHIGVNGLNVAAVDGVMVTVTGTRNVPGQTPT
jgi:hypothetical protein